MTDPKDLAEALRQTGAKKAKEVAAAAAAKAAEAAGATPAKAADAAKAATAEGRQAADGPRPSRRRPRAGAAAQADRRTFLSVGLVAWIVVGWAVVRRRASPRFTAMMGRFMFPNVLAEPPSTIKVGLPVELRARRGQRAVQGRVGLLDRPLDAVRRRRTSSTRSSRSAPTWAARPTGWPASRSSSARATAAASTSRA